MAVAKALTEHRRTRVVEFVTSGLSYTEPATEVGLPQPVGGLEGLPRGAGGL